MAALISALVALLLVTNKSEMRRILTRKAVSKNFPNCHLSIVYAIEDPDDKLEIMNTLITDWIEAHAPLKRTKLTRPPAPWLHKDDLRKLPQRRST